VVGARERVVAVREDERAEHERGRHVERVECVPGPARDEHPVGRRAAVEADGVVTEIGADDARSLRGDEGFADLGIASWFDDPVDDPRGDDTVVTGRLDVADLVTDLATLVAEVADPDDVHGIDRAGAERVAGAATDSTITAVVGADGLPHTVTATLDFGDDVPDDLVDALGPYAGTRLQLRMTVGAREQRLTVQLPS
jgi:hypothetical protein